MLVITIMSIVSIIRFDFFVIFSFFLYFKNNLKSILIYTRLIHVFFLPYKD